MIVWMIERRWNDGNWEPHEEEPTPRESLARARYTLLVEELADYRERNPGALTPSYRTDYRLLKCEVIATTEESEG